MKKMAETIESALEKLGKTRGAVVRKLRRMNCKGTIGGAFSCPVANYLEQLGVKHMGVLPNSILREDGTVRLPDAVRAFVRGFDNDEYPDLVQEEK